MYNYIVIGIDQSYKRAGVSLICDRKVKAIKSKDLSKCDNNSIRRKELKDFLSNLLVKLKGKSKHIVCIIERIRLQSQGFLNINYIKSIGALNALIVDLMSEYNIPVYSVDTRCWKAQVIGTSKPLNNKFGVPPEKWPTVKFVIKLGFEKSILKPVKGRKTKGTFVKNGVKYEYDNDAADSCGIGLFWFVGDKDKLILEH